MRLAWRHVLPEAARAMSELERVVDGSTLAEAGGARQAPRIADQRLRLLHGHAHEGRRGDR